MDTLYTFWGDITHYKTESVHFLGRMDPATKLHRLLVRKHPVQGVEGFRDFRVLGFGFGVAGLRFWGLGLEVEGLGFRFRG